MGASLGRRWERPARDGVYNLVFKLPTHMPVPLLDCRCNGLSSRDTFPEQDLRCVRLSRKLSDESLQCPGWTVIVPTQLTGKPARVRIMQIPATLRRSCCVGGVHALGACTAQRSACNAVWATDQGPCPGCGTESARCWASGSQQRRRRHRARQRARAPAAWRGGWCGRGCADHI